MQAGNERNSAGANIIRVLVVVTVAVSALRIVTEAIQESNSGDLNGLHQTLLFGGVTGGVVLLVIVSILLSLTPGVWRKRALSARFPEAIVATSRWNPEFVDFMAARLLPGHKPAELKGIAFTLVASQSGLAFWTGSREPRKVADFDWAAIESIDTGTLAISPIRTVVTIVLALRGADGRGQFALASDGWWGAFPRNAGSVEPVVAAIDSVRQAAVPRL